MESFTTSDGLILAYDIDDFTDPWKGAPTLLLLHAAMGSARRYFGWVPHLSRDYRVVRLDLRGHGRSQVPPADQPLQLDRLVGDVGELLDHLGLEAAHIVGNSAGGYLGQQLAMTRPRRTSHCNWIALLAMSANCSTISASRRPISSAIRPAAISVSNWR